MYQMPVKADDTRKIFDNAYRSIMDLQTQNQNKLGFSLLKRIGSKAMLLSASYENRDTFV